MQRLRGSLHSDVRDEASRVYHAFYTMHATGMQTVPCLQIERLALPSSDGRMRFSHPVRVCCAAQEHEEVANKEHMQLLIDTINDQQA